MTVDRVIDNIRVRSFVYDVNTGETVPFKLEMAKDIMKSVLRQMTTAELRAFPKAPQESKADCEVQITSSGKMTWRDL